MLVCSVSLRPPRRTIAAEIAEAITAADATASGQVVFATLVDDPANVVDIIDAFLGDVIVEAASASDAVSLALTYDAAVSETATAADTTDATGVVFTTWDTGTTANVTLSGGN